MMYIFIDAIVCSIILYGGIFAMIKVNPRLQLHNYPEKIRSQVPSKTKQEDRLFLFLALPLLVTILIYITGIFYLRYYNTDLSYIEVFLRWVVVYFIICAIDLFICDYWIFCTITPKFIIIPGTEGNPAYKDKSYHTRTIPVMCFFILALSFLTSLMYFVFVR